MPNATISRLRARREARGLSQIALAERAQLTRQSVGAIEAGRAVPSVDAALRLARALDATVEELFAGPAPAPEVLRAALPAGVAPGARVALGHVRGRWVAHALTRDRLARAADGVAVEGGVSPLSRLEPARDGLLVAGCAAGLGLLTDRLEATRGAGRFVWLPASSGAALDAVASGRAHVAGVHLVDPRTGEANVEDARRAAREALVLVTLARWELGLVTRAGDARRVRGVADLTDPRVRLVAREPGAGAQRVLERALRAAGVPLARARRGALRADGHLELASAVAMGAADAGVASRDAAIAYGLRFLPITEERYDLAVPRSLIADPRLARLLDALTWSAVRRELAALGYDVGPAGERVAEVGAA
ncbi:MAG: helix-turn-helix domain-containing protein [Sandaracinaceae bacterium]|nr:helix-turn-helix domain-containing protein [Sandaracinaceae bacterium]